MTDKTEGTTDESWARQALVETLAGHLSQLRSIKDMEIAWLDRYSVLTLPMIGFLVTNDQSRNPLSVEFLVAISTTYLAITMWMQYVLRKERRTYYRVLRQVVRTQNYFGLFDLGFLPQTWADGVFPKGLGPIPTRDGTQPYSSFLQRQLYTLIIYSIVIAGIIKVNGFLLPSFMMIFADVLWLIVVFRRDREELTREALAESKLMGASESWYQNMMEDQKTLSDGKQLAEH